MDGVRIDGFVRRLAGAAGSRRAIARGLAGLGLGVLLPLTGSAEIEEEANGRCAKPGRACGRDKRCCKGLACRGGRCACTGGKTRCGSRCRDLRTDRNNCGSCGFACPPGAVCAGEFCVGTIGGSGRGRREFATPRGVAVSGRSLVVADTNNSRIQVLVPGGDDIVFGGGGGGDGEFSKATGVGAAPDGTIFVADAGIPRIQKFDAAGNHELTWGDIGSGQGQFREPAGLAVDRNSNVWVVDTGNDRVQRFNQNGFFLDQFGRSGGGNGELDEPTAIAVDLDRGTVFVADTGNQRVSVFDVDGGFIRSFGRAGNGDGEFAQPLGITVNESGTVFVTDFANPRVQVFDQEGQFLSAFGEGGSDRPGSLDSPVGIAVGRDGARHVVDSRPDRIVTFSLVSQL